MSVAFTGEREYRFREILAEFCEGDSRILPALHYAQEVFGAITPEVEEYLAERLAVSRTRLREVCSFYHLFRSHRHGRYTITVCDNVVCRLAGSLDLLAVIEHRLAIRPGETTADGRFTLETVECLGACHQAPALQINGCFHGPLKPADLESMLDQLTAEATAHE